MTPEEAKKAIELDIEDYMFSVGYWSHTVSWFEGSRESSVLHFWPKEKEYRYKSIYPNGKSLVRTEHISSCNINDDGKTIPYMSDLYTLRKLPKCKKCLRVLKSICSNS